MTTERRYKNCTCEDIPENTIHKIGAAFVKDSKIVVVRKRGKEEYIILGGVHDRSETHEENLRKEVTEELQLSLRGFTYLGRFEDIALFEQVPIIMDIYLVDCFGKPHPDSEIKEYLWVGKDYDRSKIKLGSVLEKFVIPELSKRGLM